MITNTRFFSGFMDVRRNPRQNISSHTAGRSAIVIIASAGGIDVARLLTASPRSAKSGINRLVTVFTAPFSISVPIYSPTDDTNIFTGGSLNGRTNESSLSVISAITRATATMRSSPIAA